MIRSQQFVALAAATAVALVSALGVYTFGNRWSAGRVEGAPFLPQLASQLGSVAALEISQGGRKLTVKRSGQTWTVAEAGGYPVKPEAVRALLVTLTQAQLIERKTELKDKHALLELEDPTGKDAKSRGLRLLDAASKPLADIVVGKTRWDAFGSGKGGIYVRRAGETQTWLATGDPKVSSDIKDWVVAQVFSSQSDKVSKLSIEIPGEEALVIERAPPAEKADADKSKAGKAPPSPPTRESKFRLSNMPDGKKLKQGVTIDQIVESLGTIDLEDVRKLDATPAGDKVTVLKLEQEGGPAVTFRLRKDGDASWLSLDATGTDGDARKMADELNAKAKGWEYKIPSWKAEQIVKRRADLFETT